MNHASHAVVQSAVVADGDGVDGAVAIDNYEKPVSSVKIVGHKWPGVCFGQNGHLAWKTVLFILYVFRLTIN